MDPGFDWMLFIGRFHPLVVHLPLGFLMLAILIELVNYKLRQKHLSGALGFVWLAGAISALLAVVIGFLLASDGSYSGDTLFWHQWMGTGVVVLSFACWWSQKKRSLFRAYRASTFLLSVFLVLAGHLGGNLTHGSDYLLEHAPPIVQRIARYSDPASADSLFYDSPDSIPVFEALIQPVLNKKCVSCHNTEKQKGGLILTSNEGIASGGENGAIISHGKPMQSELFLRVTLPPDNARFMPPKGAPLSYDELQIFKWWIATGAGFEDRIGDREKNDDIFQALQRSHGLDIREKPYLETLVADSIPPELLDSMRSSGLKVNFISSGSNLLDVTFPHSPIIEMQTRSLLAVRDNIVYLNLTRTGVVDDQLHFIASLKNLTRLRLGRNPVTDAGMEFIKPLKHLESLNLYSTNISDRSLEMLVEMGSLKSIFIWKTSIHKDEVKKLQDLRPDIMVDQGFGFATVPKTQH